MLRCRLSILGRQPKAYGLGPRLSARSDVELAQDRRDVVMDRFILDDQSIGNLGVRKSGGQHR
jgi:hypothetical protein